MSTEKSERYHHQNSDNQIVPFEHIVIVENNEADLFIHETLISTLGLGNKVEKRPNFEDVMSELTSVQRLTEVPDLVIFSMPGQEKDEEKHKRGENFLNRFGDLPEFIRAKCKLIIVTSASSKEEKLKALMNPSVIRYLQKPIDAHHFRDFMFM
jgi:hypothetical protein